MNSPKETKPKPQPKIYELEHYGKKYHIILEKNTYANNGRLAISMLECTPKGKVKDYFDTLTVNLNGYCVGKDEQFIDTNNLPSDIIKWLVKNDIGNEVNGVYGCSGYCTYPLFRFNEQALSQMLEA